MALNRKQLREEAELQVIKKYVKERNSIKKDLMKHLDKEDIASEYARVKIGKVYDPDWYKEYSKSTLAEWVANNDVVKNHNTEIHNLVQEIVSAGTRGVGATSTSNT